MIPSVSYRGMLPRERLGYGCHGGYYNILVATTEASTWVVDFLVDLLFDHMSFAFAWKI